MRRTHVLLIAVFLLALALRAWGIGFGLPYTYHPDEHQYVDTALQVLGGELNPGRFNNPSLYKYALASVDALWFLGARASGSVASLRDFQDRAAADPTTAYLVARALTALLGALTALVTYGLGRRAYGRRTGLVAAALMAGMYLHGRESHFAVGDVPATLLSTIGLVFALRVLDGGRRRDYLVAGACVGLAAAAKYTGALVAVPLVAAHLLAAGDGPRTWPRRLFDRRLVAAGAVAVAVFLAAVPYAVLDWTTFRADVALLAERGRTGFKGLELAPDVGWVFYLKSLAWGLGWPLLAASLAGVAAALVRRRREDVVLLALPIVLYAYLGGQLLLFERFLLPALPVLAVLAGDLVVHTSDRLAVAPRSRLLTAGAATALLLALPVADTLRCDWLLTRTDTRTLAKRWAEATIPAGTKILVHTNGPELAGSDRTPPGSTRTYDLTEIGTTGLGKKTLAAYRDEGFAYIIVSSFAYDRRLLDPARQAQEQAIYDTLAREAMLVAEFRPYAGDSAPPFLYAQIYGPATDLWRFERPGPTIKAYWLPPR
jgi:hypothetical protein